jgi:transglutaminase-like putative cysteine protease
MPFGAQQFDVIPLQRAIDHYFELALYLLVLTGFGTLAGSGGVDLPSVLLVGVALAIRGYLLAKKNPFVISERWITPLSLAYFAFFAVDYFVFSRGFLPATIHLALFGVVVRMFSLRRERDHVTLAILAFLMVLASAVLTVDSIFLFAFAIFMLMAVVTFVLMEMRRSGRDANVEARHSNDPHEHRHLAFALVRIAPALMILILLCGAALFFVMPRMSAGNLGGYSYGTDFSAGFSDHVQLGQIGQIQQSNSVVMHVKIDGDAIGRYDLHWRGVSLANFDGHIWSSPQAQSLLQRQSDNSFAVPALDDPARVPAASHTQSPNLIRYRVLMEPIGTNVFFLAPRARSVSGDYRALAADSGGAVYDFDPTRSISHYSATSDITAPSPYELRAASNIYPALVRNTYVPLPAVDPRIRQLALQITALSRNDYDKAAAIELYLKTHYGYTLALPQTAETDPVASFLFVRKKGHCEYFASSMAVMLRTLGIPTRVVNGFRSDEFNDLTGSYVVRAKDAHAWVETYFPGYGWQMFDPTPAGNGTGTPQGWGRLALYVDAMASFWREWIISYDSSHQYVLGQAAISGSRGAWENSRRWARKHYSAMLKWARQTQGRVQHSPRRWAVLGLGMVLLLVLLGNMGRVVRAMYEKWLAAHPEHSPEQSAAMWYHRMARALARRGMKKSRAQTAQEFARQIEDTRLQRPVARFTDVYESARFGNSAADARRLAELYEEVEAATRDR